MAGSSGGSCRSVVSVLAEKAGLVFTLAVVLNFLLFSRSRGVRSERQGRQATSLCAELITPNDYRCTEYRVVTDDGFILGLQNLAYRRGQTGPRNTGPSVLLQHGVLAAGDQWVANSPEESLAFILADAGYDVWIGNNRNVQWSHGHQTFAPSDSGYWNWTYDELATFDLKASVEFVYNQAGGEQIFYIGHSQGTLVLLAGLTGGTFKDEILGCLRGAVMLAPAAAVGHISKSAFISWIGFASSSDAILPSIHYGQFNPNIYVNMFCRVSTLLCNVIFVGILGHDSYINQSRLMLYSDYYPQATSSRNYNHLGQSFRTNTFGFYDEGSTKNLLAYGQTTPPKYDLTTFPTSLPLQIWTGGIDGLADPKNVAVTLAELPSTNRTVINLSNYGHADFIWGYNAHLDVYPTLIEFLSTH